MFETLMTMLRTLETVGDVDLYVDSDGDLSVTFEDFAGFSDDWDEETREYEMPELVGEVLTFLGQFPCEGDFYQYYDVEGHEVQVGYSSYDI